MMRPYEYNMVRLTAYVDFFDGFLSNQYDPGTAINLLTDVRPPEVAKAFAMKLTRRAMQGPIRPLQKAVADVLRQCADSAFGTHDHEQLPGWFLQNNEGFLASCTHKLLRHYSRTSATESSMRAAYGALFQVAEGMKNFIGLKQVSSGTHALMAACHHSRTNFLGLESENICHAHLAFVEQLADEILKEPDQDMHDRHNSLSYFAKSARWQQVSKACSPWLSEDSNLAKMHAAIKASAEKPPKEAEIVVLASAFLSTASPARSRRPTQFCTPKKKRAQHQAISKHSADPFMELVRKLVE